MPLGKAAILRRGFWIEAPIFTNGETYMKRKITVLLALVASVGIGAATVQGLHAQTKPKAFTIAEIEVLDRAALDAFVKVGTPVVQEAGGHPLALGQKIVARVGEAPKAVILVEWDSIEKAEAYYKSPTYTRLAPQRDKAWRAIRSFVVESATPGLAPFEGSKAYAISEYEPLDKAASEAYNKAAVSVVQTAGGRASGVAGGKIVALVGEAPKGVTLVEFNSLGQAETFYKSPDLTNLQPQLEKARKVTRSYIVDRF